MSENDGKKGYDLINLIAYALSLGFIWRIALNGSSMTDFIALILGGSTLWGIYILMRKYEK